MTAVTHNFSITPASYSNNIDTGLVKKNSDQMSPVSGDSLQFQLLKTKVDVVLQLIELVHESLDLEDAIESVGNDEADVSDIELEAAEQDSNVDPDGRNGGGHSGQDQSKGEEQDTQAKDEQVSAKGKRSAGVQQYRADVSNWLGAAEDFVDVSQKILRSPRTFSSPGAFSPGSSVGAGPTEEEMWWKVDSKNTINYQRDENPDLVFAQITAEYTRIVDKSLILQLNEQKMKNGRIADYNMIMEKLRAISGDKDDKDQIPDADFDVEMEPHPDSPIHDLMKQEAEDKRLAALEKLKNNPGYAALVSKGGVGEPKYFYESKGEIWGFWPGANGSDKQEDGAWWHPLDRKPNESIKADVIAVSKVDKNKISLRDMMAKYGLTPLPTTAKLARVMLETTKSRVDTEAANLQLDMVRLNKLNSNRSEGYSMLANNNKQVSDTRNGIISKT